MTYGEILQFVHVLVDAGIFAVLLQFWWDWHRAQKTKPTEESQFPDPMADQQQRVYPREDVVCYQPQQAGGMPGGGAGASALSVMRTSRRFVMPEARCEIPALDCGPCAKEALWRGLTTGRRYCAGHRDAHEGDEPDGFRTLSSERSDA